MINEDELDQMVTKILDAASLVAPSVSRDDAETIVAVAYIIMYKTLFREEVRV